MTVETIMIGNFAHVTKQYIRKTLINKANIDKRILFLTYAGMDEEKLLEIQEMVQQYCLLKKFIYGKRLQQLQVIAAPAHLDYCL